MSLNLETTHFSLILTKWKDSLKKKKEYMASNVRWFSIKSRVNSMIHDSCFEDFPGDHYTGIYIRTFLCWITGKKTYKTLKSYHKFVMAFCNKSRHFKTREKERWIAFWDAWVSNRVGKMVLTMTSNVWQQAQSSPNKWKSVELCWLGILQKNGSFWCERTL